MALSSTESERFFLVARDLLQRGWSIRFVVSGSSMWPALKSGDGVIVTPIDRDRVRPGQIVFYHRAGRLYLHRVRAIETGPDGARWYRVAGDGARMLEPPVAAGSVLGCAVMRIRNGKMRKISTHRSRFYQLMVRALCRMRHMCSRWIRKQWVSRGNSPPPPIFQV